MKISVTVYDLDYMKFNEYHMLNSRQGKKTLATYKLAMPVFSIVAILILALLGVHTAILIAEIVFLTVFSVIWLFKSSELYFKEARKNIEKLKQEGKLPYTQNAVLEFGDEAIVETTDNSMKKVEYREVNRIGFTEEHIFIFFGAVEAFVIPKRCITEEQTALEQLLHEKVPER